VDNANAIWNGRLANNSLFFGGLTAEVLSDTNVYGAWDEDHANSIGSTNPWFTRGGEAPNSETAGITAFHRISAAGGSVNLASHRTILSGY
jgi:hypothetical protein